MSFSLAASLLGHLFGELWRRATPIVLACAALGVFELWRRGRRFASGLIIIFLGAGPGFFLATRFDLGGWVARTVLESALVMPAVVTCLCAAFGLAWVRRRQQSAGALLAAAMVLVPLGQNAPAASHRDDFSAYDYAKDLRRSLPPGSAAAVGGDTALYASRYLDLTQPDGQARRLIQYQDAAAGPRPQYVLGLSLLNLARLGLGPDALSPAGLVQSAGPAPTASPWEFSVLRQGQALRRQESYARDILLAYAFAHYLGGTLKEARRDPGAQRDYVTAAALDPEDYQIEYNSAR